VLKIVTLIRLFEILITRCLVKHFLNWVYWERNWCNMHVILDLSIMFVTVQQAYVMWLYTRETIWDDCKGNSQCNNTEQRGATKNGDMSHRTEKYHIEWCASAQNGVLPLKKDKGWKNERSWHEQTKPYIERIMVFKLE